MSDNSVSKEEQRMMELFLLGAVAGGRFGVKDGVGLQAVPDDVSFVIVALGNNQTERVDMRRIETNSGLRMRVGYSRAKNVLYFYFADKPERV